MQRCGDDESLGYLYKPVAGHCDVIPVCGLLRLGFSPHDIVLEFDRGNGYWLSHALNDKIERKAFFEN